MLSPFLPGDIFFSKSELPQELAAASPQRTVGLYRFRNSCTEASFHVACSDFGTLLLLMEGEPSTPKQALMSSASTALDSPLQHDCVLLAFGVRLQSPYLSTVMRESR